jgi:hypothetical protein
VNHLNEQYINETFTTMPDEAAKREALYHRKNALNDLVGQLGAYVGAKDELAAALEQQEEEQHHHE